jgi:hypothetical protein
VAYVPAVPYTPRRMLPLGKKPATHDRRDIRLQTLLEQTAPLPAPPHRFGHANLYRDDGWSMLGNDRYGDCVFAGAAHETMMTNHLARRTVTFTDEAVLADYGAVTGFTPDNPASDQGTDVRDALKYRQKTGVVDGHGTRHKIGAYVALTPGDWDELMQAVYVFAAVGVGVEFPDSAMDQFDHGEPWDVVDGARIEGGHYIPCMGRSSVGVGGVVTWARRQSVTRAFYEKYADEAWAIVFPEELRAGKTERGFDLAGLNAALAQLR